MTMTVGKGRFSHFLDHRPYAARVELEVDTSAAATDISLQCSGEGWVEQGCLEDVSETGYEPWKGGARAGVQFALQVAGVSATVVIRRITGMVTDTNPTAVAAAAADAIWNALDFKPSKEVADHLESVVTGSSPRGHLYVPTVEELLGRPA
jgi:hypothetical protein